MTADRDTLPDDAFLVPLEHRGLLRLAGEAVFDFLQRLVTQDMRRLSPGRALHGALLTPQGKLLHEFLLVRPGEEPVVLIEADAAGIDDLARRLTIYRLRTPVEIARLDDRRVFACDPRTARDLLGDACKAGVVRRIAPNDGDGFGLWDPRGRALGARLHLSEGAKVETRGGGADARRSRLALGIAEGTGELPPERFFALEANLDRIGSISFDKGCYVGQEVATRTHRRGRVKKRLAPLRYEGRPPAAGTAIVAEGADGGREVRIGEVAVPGLDGFGLALVRVEEAEGVHPASVRLVDDGRTAGLGPPPDRTRTDRGLDE